MVEQIKELFIRIEYLEKIITAIQENINGNIQSFIGILGLSVAILGGALYFLTQYLVNKRVDKELDKRIEKLKSDLNSDLKAFLYKNPQILVYKLNNTKVLDQFASIVISINGSDDSVPTYTLDYLDKFKVYSPISKRYLQFTVSLEETTFTFDLKDYDKSKDGDYFNLTIMMLNKNYDLITDFEY